MGDFLLYTTRHDVKRSSPKGTRTHLERWGDIELSASNLSTKRTNETRLSYVWPYSLDFGPGSFAEPTICLERCMARVWNAGSGGQCTRPRRGDSDFCGLHQRELAQKTLLTHGRVDGPIPFSKRKEFEAAQRQVEKRRCTVALDAEEVEAKRPQQVANKKKRCVESLRKRLNDWEASQKEEVAFKRVPMIVVHGSSADAPLKGYLAPRTAFSETVKPSYILPFTILRGRLSEDVLKFLQDAPEWRWSADEWEALKNPDERRMGFEMDKPAVEMYAHCNSQSSPMCAFNQYLYGRRACGPAPLPVMAFRHAMVLINGSRLRALEEEIVKAMKDRSEDENDILGYAGVGLSLTRSAFAIATMQLRWGRRHAMHMGRHVDGGPSILHLSIGIFGRRTLKCEVLKHEQPNGSYLVEVVSDELGPGDVYVSSPACCYHSVDYPAQDLERPAQPPNTLVIHLRSDILRQRHGARMFWKSNQLMSETLGPCVAQSLARDPLELPSMSDLSHVVRSWKQSA